MIFGEIVNSHQAIKKKLEWRSFEKKKTTNKKKQKKKQKKTNNKTHTHTPKSIDLKRVRRV